MIEYNEKGNKKEPGYIYSGEQKDIVIRVRDDNGEVIDVSSLLKTEGRLQMIIRNINGVVFCEFSTEPKDVERYKTEGSSYNPHLLAWDSGINAFKAKLTCDDTIKMCGLYIAEVKIVSTDYSSQNAEMIRTISVSDPFEVRNDFVKRMKEER